jgi:single-stranded DNA-binding protein
MNKLILTGAVISKGFGTQPAIRFTEKGDGARFKIGQRVYDSRAENNTRWLNLSVKAFGALAERISKMGLRDGSWVNLIGRLDEDVWDDGDVRKRQYVVILDEIEYASAGSPGEKKPPAAPSTPPDTAPEPGEFTGFEPFGGEQELY